MTEQKVRYIEEYPGKISREFSSGVEYNLFFKQRFDEVCVILDLFKSYSKYDYRDWKYHTIKLNKDGTPRKYFNPKHLQTKECREKQEIKFREYQERLKKEKEVKKQQKEQLDNDAYKEAIKILLKNKVDLNRLDIKIKRH
jgi:hypothetical protein